MLLICRGIVLGWQQSVQVEICSPTPAIKFLAEVTKEQVLSLSQWAWHLSLRVNFP